MFGTKTSGSSKFRKFLPIALLLTQVTPLAQALCQLSRPQVDLRPLSAEIESLLKTELDADDDRVQVDRVQALFAKYGIPSSQEVDEAAARDFVVLLTYDQPLGFMQKVAPAVQAAFSEGRLPTNSKVFFEACLRRKAAMTAFGKPTNPDLEKKIEMLLKADQGVRQTQGIDPAKMSAQDEEDRPAVESILHEYGMPTSAMVGPEAATDFVVLLQHQPASLRKEALPKLKANVDAGQASAKDYAMMFDRSQTDQAKPEAYGVNLICQPNGSLSPGPLVDPEHVEDRRAAIGLMPLSTYIRMAVLLAPDFCALTSKN